MPGFRIDLTGLVPAKLVPAPLRRAARQVDAAHDAFERALDRAASPIAARRVAGCTVATRAHVVAIADVPAIQYEYEALPVALLRLRVERPGGDAETCVRQYVPRALRRLAVGSSVRALAHPEDPRRAYVDWHETARRLGLAGIAVPDTMDQFAWPAADEWPAPGVIEVRDGGRHARRLAERRAAWRPATARLTAAEASGGWHDGRMPWTLGLDVGGRTVAVRERMPELAAARLAAHREVGSGRITRIETVVNTDAVLAVLVAPGGEVAVDWQATFAQEAWRADA